MDLTQNAEKVFFEFSVIGNQAPVTAMLSFRRCPQKTSYLTASMSRVIMPAFIDMESYNKSFIQDSQQIEPKLNWISSIKNQPHQIEEYPKKTSMANRYNAQCTYQIY